MSNHPARRWRGKHEHQLDMLSKYRQDQANKESGTERRRRKAVERAARVALYARQS